LLLAAIGAVIPYIPLVGWLRQQTLGGDLLGRLFSELFSTRIGASFGLDVILSAVTLLAFMFFERHTRPHIKVWPAILGTLLIGVSFGLPLYLYAREKAREEAS
jgi:drug/metabolite transporter (DMT)-like permease